MRPRCSVDQAQMDCSAAVVLWSLLTIKIATASHLHNTFTDPAAAQYISAVEKQP